MNNVNRDEINFIQISGTLENFEYSHDFMGEKFYKGIIKSVRRSKEFDLLPFITSERNIEGELNLNSKIKIKGSLRSYNVLDEITNKSKLKVMIYVSWKIEVILEETNEDFNDVFLVGYICKDPIIRNTPKKRVISDVMLAVNRKTYKCDYIPCIAWENTAETLSTFKTGDKVKIKGRIQSRNYEKVDENGNSRTFTVLELSIFNVYKLNDEQ